LKSLSIVSVNKNNFNGLVKTLKSLQEIKNIFSFDHIIVDGKSSDLRIDLNDLKFQYNFEFISENDSGIYEAMNKGIRLSNNGRLLFLNSGDTISDYTKFEQFIHYNSEYDLLYSNVLKVNEDNSLIHSKFPSVLTLDYMICYGLPHQATIISKNLFDKVGLYNENYKIISDWVFFMESLFFHNATYKHIDLAPICFDGTGISNQNSYLKLIIKEQLHYISNRFPEQIYLYKTGSPYVKKYFRQMPRWKRMFMKFSFLYFNHF
jgi:hypothetical protein